MKHRIAVPLAAVALLGAGGVAGGCGENDVERGAEDAKQGAKTAGKEAERGARKAERGAKTAGREAQDEAGKAKRSVEKQTKD